MKVIFTFSDVWVFLSLQILWSNISNMTLLKYLQNVGQSKPSPMSHKNHILYSFTVSSPKKTTICRKNAIKINIL